MAHEPLSQKLARILEQPAASGQLTLNDLIERTEGRGLFTIIILLCLPFIAPLSVPGMSTPFGIAIILISTRLLKHTPPRLPKRIGDRVLTPKVREMLGKGGVRFLRVLETAVRPRETRWLSWRSVQVANTIMVMFQAFLLALPLPPIPPLTNALPSYAIILLAASMMEEDGVLIWAGYFASLFTMCYFLFWAEFIGHHFRPWFQAVLHFLHRLAS